MFTRSELLQLERNCTNKKLLGKIQSMLYADMELKEEIKKAYKENELLYIEKSNNLNDYYVHYLYETDNDISLSIKLVEKYEEKYGFDLNICTTMHDSANEFWHYSDCYPIYAREDIKEEIINNAKIFFNQKDYENYSKDKSIYTINLD